MPPVGNGGVQKHKSKQKVANFLHKSNKYKVSGICNALQLMLHATKMRTNATFAKRLLHATTVTVYLTLYKGVACINLQSNDTNNNNCNTLAIACRNYKHQ